MGVLMLSERATPSSKRGRLQVRSVDPVLNRLLEALLREWGHELVEAGEPADLFLLQEVRPNSEEGENELWLTSSGCQERDSIAVPMVIEELWAAIEGRLHSQPRRHLRLALSLSGEIAAGGLRAAVQVSSLSDYGARFRAPRELARDDEWLLRLDCCEVPVAVRGRVIYCFPQGDLDGAAGYEVGLIFTEAPAQLRQTLRDFITASYLGRVRARLSPAEFAAALPWLRLSAGVLAKFDYPPLARG
jgi:hypothetical protein